jgi:hypothetical protein
MVGLHSNNKLTKESRLLMSAKPYTIESLLEGKHYRSHTRHDEGTILYATKRSEIWYGSDFEAYAIEVRSTRGIKNFWATVAVKIGE